jgi:hypothetical protein
MFIIKACPVFWGSFVGVFVPGRGENGRKFKVHLGSSGWGIQRGLQISCPFFYVGSKGGSKWPKTKSAPGIFRLGNWMGSSENQTVFLCEL